MKGGLGLGRPAVFGCAYLPRRALFLLRYLPRKDRLAFLEKCLQPFDPVRRRHELHRLLQFIVKPLAERQLLRRVDRRFPFRHCDRRAGSDAASQFLGGSHQ